MRTVKIIDKMILITNEMLSIVHEQQEIIEMVQPDTGKELVTRITEVEDELDIIEYNLRQDIDTDDGEPIEKGAADAD